MSLNPKYVATMEAQLGELDAALDALAAAGESAGIGARAAVQEQLQALRACRDEAHRTFRDLQVASATSGAHMQAGMKVAWTTMQKALAKRPPDPRA